MGFVEGRDLRGLEHIAARLVQINEDWMKDVGNVLDPRVSGVKWGENGREEVSDYPTCLARGSGTDFDLATALAAFYNHDGGSKIAKVAFEALEGVSAVDPTFFVRPVVVSGATGERLWSPATRAP